MGSLEMAYRVTRVLNDLLSINLMTSLLSHVDINTIVLAVIGVLLGVYQWRSGSSKISSDTIEAYKSQVELYEKRLSDQVTTINTMSSQLGELRGMIVAKDKQIDEMRKILENRNPELESILKELTHFMQSVDTRLTEHTEKLSEVREHQKRPVTVTTDTTISKP